MRNPATFPFVACCLALLFSHPATADSNIDTVSLNELAKQEAAVRTARKAVADAEHAYGANDIKVADKLDDMAQVYEKQREYAVAEPFYIRALKIREASLGENHLAVAATLDNLGLLYLEQEKYAAAEPLFKRSLAIEEKAYGADSPKLIEPLFRLAELQESQRQFAAALPLHRRFRGSPSQLPWDRNSYQPRQPLEYPACGLPSPQWLPYWSRSQRPRQAGASCS